VRLSNTARDAILNGQTYVNIHTAANTGGEVRGQIAPVLMTAALSGVNERRAAVATTGFGSGVFALVRDQLTLNIAYSDLLSTATAADIHGRAGFFGVEDALVSLAPVNGGSFGISGTLVGTVQLPYEALLDVIDGQTYVNVETTGNPDGEIRGQIMR